MNKLFICGSNREKNCYKILKDLKEEQDDIISLAKKDMKFCLGCNVCQKGLEKYCVLNDYMQEVYPKILSSNQIIIASPIYMNQITGILKNFIDRFNPFLSNNALEGKKVYLILTGQMSEEENREEIKNIGNYFLGLSEFMGFKFKFLKYLSSGDVLNIDDVTKVNSDYKEIIESIKQEIK